VLDTNVIVAAGFRPASASGRILDRVRAGALRLVWNERTREETERILRRIPPLDWDAVADLFRPENRCEHRLDPARHEHLSGSLDREFLALAEAAGVTLVTADGELLATRARSPIPVASAGEYLSREDSPAP